MLSPEEESELASRYELAFVHPPDEAAPTEAEQECNRLLAALKDVRDEIDANRRAYEMEVRNADRWLERVNGSPRRRETLLLTMLEAVAPFVPRYGSKKSRDLPRGTIGWRSTPERITVEDPAAVVAWAKEHGLAHLLKREEKLPHAVIEKEWKEARRIIPDYVPPGCRLVDAEERFYVEPLDVS
jgi:hypothetical protein